MSRVKRIPGSAEAIGVSRCEGLDTAGWEKPGGGAVSNGVPQPQRGEIHRRYAHVAYETTPRVVGNETRRHRSCQ